MARWFCEDGVKLSLTNIQDGKENNIIIDSISEEDDLYQKWSPKLLAFAAQCHADHPAPPESSLSDSDRAMQQISRGGLSFFPDRHLPLRKIKNILCVLRASVVSEQNSFHPLLAWFQEGIK
jgi:hypothetical protein